MSANFDMSIGDGGVADSDVALLVSSSLIFSGPAGVFVTPPPPPFDSYSEIGRCNAASAV